MKEIAVKFFSLLLVSILSCFAVNAQTISVTGTIQKSVKRGSINKGTIVLLIPKEQHINSKTPTSEFMIPTTVRFRSVQVRITDVRYPKGKNRKFDFADEPINVYEAKTLIPFKFYVSRRIKSKMIRIRAVIRYQSCTNEVCFPPAKKEIFLTAKVR